MPTVGWVYEDAVERYGESLPIAPPIDIPCPVFACKWCGKEFPSPEKLRSHFSLAHPLELPALYVHGEPLLRESVLRSAITENDVELFQCSRCEVQIDGSPWQLFPISVFRSQFARSRNATWNVRLTHERSEDDSLATEEYHVRFRIPANNALDKVDEHFIQTLVLEELRHSDLERFVRGLPVDAPVCEYGNALGDYALGIILKERRKRSVAEVSFGEFAIKMRSALDILRLFRRPVALAVSSSIRFNLNDFYDYSVAAAVELEAALAFFRSVTRDPVVSSIATPTLSEQHKPAIGSVWAISPIDKVSHRLLAACNLLTHGGRLQREELEALRQLIYGTMPISEQDLAKVHVICAEGYLRIACTADAMVHLRAIQFDPMFKGWAQHCMEDISRYEE